MERLKPTLREWHGIRTDEELNTAMKIVLQRATEGLDLKSTSANDLATQIKLNIRKLGWKRSLAVSVTKNLENKIDNVQIRFKSPLTRQEITLDSNRDENE